jgi:hypothetical protein
LRDIQPQLTVFKSGYQHRILFNEARSNAVYSGKSDWSGKPIDLKKFSGTPKEWLETLERVIPRYERREDARDSIMLRAILAEENSVPDSIIHKRPFFDNIVRRLLEGK